MTKLARLLAPILLLSIVVPLTRAASASPRTTCGKWTVVNSDNLGVPVGSNGNELFGVAARNATDAWAVGYAYRYGTNKAMVEHWDGTKWTASLAASVANQQNALQGVAVLGRHNVWAVGYWNAGSSYTAVIEHWTGRKWHMVTTNAPSGSNRLFGIAALSAKNIWAVGWSDQGGGTINTLLLHWNGTAWHPASSPPNPFNENELQAVARVPGTTDLLAVGSGYSSAWHSLFLHMHNGTWTQETSEDQGYNGFRAVAATSMTNAWALGVDQSVNPSLTLGEQWNGSSWTLQTTPNPVSGSYAFNGATAQGSTIWIAGSRRPVSDAKAQMFKWTAANGFSAVTTATPAHTLDSTLYAVARIPGTKHLWAVGSWFNNNSDDITLIESYC